MGRSLDKVLVLLALLASPTPAQANNLWTAATDAGVASPDTPAPSPAALEGWQVIVYPVFGFAPLFSGGASYPAIDFPNILPGGAGGTATGQTSTSLNAAVIRRSPDRKEQVRGSGGVRAPINRASRLKEHQPRLRGNLFT